MNRDRYIHLYRDKWMKVEPSKEYEDYYENETQDRVVHYHHEIVISESCPGVLVGDSDTLRGNYGRATN